MNDFQVIEVKGKRVLTTKQIAEAYGTTEEKVRWNFKYNKKKYEEGKHYILIQGNELRELKTECEFQTLFKQAKSVCLWTEKGALLHAKSLNTDKAWEVYEYLVDFYFRVKEERQETEKRQQASEKNEVIPVKTGVEKVPKAIGTKSRTIPVYGLKPAKKMVVDIPRNAEAIQLIGEMRKYLTGMDALLDTYCMFLAEEEFKKIAYAVQGMSAKIERTALFLYTFKPNIVEEYM